MRYHLILIHKPQTGDSSEYANNMFDLKAACPVCKTGATVIAPHKLKDISTAFDKHLFSTYTRDHFISEMLFAQLRDFDVNTDSLVRCTNQKGTIVPFYHLRSDFIMPKPFRQQGFIQYEEHCLDCGRDNYSRIGKGGKIFGEVMPFDPEDIELTYSKTIFEVIKKYDFLFTFHCTVRSLLDKDGKIKVLPKPCLIVSERVKDAFTGFGIDYASYWPVSFSGEEK